MSKVLIKTLAGLAVSNYLESRSHLKPRFHNQTEEGKNRALESARIKREARAKKRLKESKAMNEIKGTIAHCERMVNDLVIAAYAEKGVDYDRNYKGSDATYKHSSDGSESEYFHKGYKVLRVYDVSANGVDNTASFKYEN